MKNSDEKEKNMDYEKIYKVLMEIVADQNNVVIESKLKKKESKNERKKH